MFGGAAKIKEADVKAREAKYNRKVSDRAYRQAERRYGTGTEQMQAGESALMSELAQSPEMLQQIKKDIAEGSTEAQQQQAGQMNVALAQQGVRGSQAARLRGRESGRLSKDLMRDVNRLTYEDLLRRSGAKTDYLAGKARGGQAMMGSV